MLDWQLCQICYPLEIKLLLLLLLLLFLTNNHAILKCLLASYSTVIYSKQLNYLDPISNNVSQCMTSLLKLEITVSFLAFIASSFRVTEDD